MRKEIKKMRSRIAEINTRFSEVADLLTSEKRGLTDDEKVERDALIQEKEILQLRIERMQSNEPVNDVVERSESAFAETVYAMVNKRSIPESMQSMVNGMNIGIPMTRSVQDTASAEALVPLTIGDIIKPLEKGLILDKVGCKMQYGIVGDWVLPVVAGIEATIEEENAEVADKTVDITKIKPTPKRVSLAIPVSIRAIDQSNSALVDIVRTQMVMGLQRLLNKWMFSPTKITSTASNGCFVVAHATPSVSVAADTAITWKNVMELKGSVLKTGVEFDGTAAYVCSASTYAELEATPKDSGSGLMILENGKINGYPVFVTEYVGENVLGFGIFSYELVGQFGKMHMVVDPYTGAKKNLVYFVLNTDFDMLSCRTEAFGILKRATA